MRWVTRVVVLLAACGYGSDELARASPQQQAPAPPAAPNSPQQAPAPPAAPQSASAPAAAEEPDPPRIGSRPWIDPTGTSILGFGILRVVPEPGKRAVFNLRYVEKPSVYTAGDEFQLFVLPGDAFATKTSAYAHEFLAYARTHGALPNTSVKSYALGVQFTADAETTVLVCSGPLTTADVGRPPGDEPVYRVDVRAKDGAFEWVESEAGEVSVTSWTNRPEVKRGKPYPTDNVWLEVRPLILYDGRLVRAADEPAASTGDPPSEDPERLADQRAVASRWDGRVVMTRALAERFKRVPTRWR